jgi:hypothetical protein
LETDLTPPEVKFLPEQPVAVQGEMANRSWLLTVDAWPELNA